MKKLGIIPLVMVVSLMFTACGANTSTTSSEAATTLAAAATADKGEIAIKVNDETASASEILTAVNNYCEMLGISSDDESYADYINDLKSDVMNEYTDELVKKVKAKELGLDKLSETELKACQDEVDKFKADIESYYSDQVRGDDAYSGATEDVIKKEIEKQCKEYYDYYGYTDASMLQIVKDKKIQDKLYDKYTKDVSVTDAEVQAEYKNLVSTDKDSYENDFASFETAATDEETFYYAPAGFKYIKQIFISFTPDSESTASDATETADEATIDGGDNLDEAVKEADTTGTAYVAAKAVATSATDDSQGEVVDEGDDASADTTTDSEPTAEQKATALKNATNIYKNLTSQNFESVMKEKSDDPGSTEHAKGYVVSPDASDTSYYTEFTAAAATLKNIGDISKPIESSDGYHILMYAGNVIAPTFDEVKDTVKSDLISTKQDDEFQKLMAQWKSKMTIDVHPEAIGLDESALSTSSEAEATTDGEAIDQDVDEGEYVDADTGTDGGTAAATDTASAESTTAAN